MTIDMFLGIGQGAWSRRWLAARMSDMTFHEAPNYLAHPDAAAMTRCGTDAVRQALRGRTGDIVIAESQAAPAVVQALSDGTIAPPSRLILLQPLGMNADRFGCTPKQRRRELLRRSVRFWKHPNQSLGIIGNRRTALTLLRQSLRHPFRLRGAYLFGANQDCLKQLEHIATTIRVEVYAAIDDSLFPYGELKATLTSGVTLHKLDGTHLNRATPNGLEQLRLILADATIG